MDIMIIVIVAIIGFVILAIGGGVGWWIYIASRPKKMTWEAWVYQVGDGIIDYRQIKGKADIHYKLSDLKPFTKDIIEKIDKKSGATYYWLQKLKKPAPTVTADCVEVWTQNKKIVRVLLDGDTCTLLKVGYDRKIASILFRPMPHDRINMIKTELSERKDRIENTKDVLMAITPFVVIGISILGLVVIAYFQAQAAIKIGEMNVKMTEDTAAAQAQLAEIYTRAGLLEPPEEDTEIKKEDPPEIPP